MGFYRAARHVQLGGNFGIITALQKQLCDLPFARTQPYGLLLHQTLPSFSDIA